MALKNFLSASAASVGLIRVPIVQHSNSMRPQTDLGVELRSVGLNGARIVVVTKYAGIGILPTLSLQRLDQQSSSEHVLHPQLQPRPSQSQLLHSEQQ